MPLPEKRRRRLSVSQDENTRSLRVADWFGEKRDHTAQVEESRLLSLPAEIRDMIWKYAMGGRDLHITSGEQAKHQPRTRQSLWLKHETNRWKVARCHGYVDCSRLDFQPMWQLHPQAPGGGIVRDGKRWTSSEGYHCGTCGQFFDYSDFGEWLPTTMVTEYNEADASPLRPDGGELMQRKRSQDAWNPLELLQTCRLIYREALPHLYKSNHFKLWTHQQAVDWPTTLLPATRNLITSLYVPIRVRWHYDIGIYDVDTMLTSLSKLENLRYVEIEMIYPNVCYMVYDWNDNECELRKLAKVVRGNGGQALLKVPWIHKTQELEQIEGLEIVKGPKEASIG